METKIDKEFWENRYSSKETGWDLGSISTPLKEYVDQLPNKNIRILIPGCGNGYEAEYLHQQGFQNVFIADYASEPLENFKKRVPSFPITHLLQTDFFEINEKFDLVLEQTFFCALDPKFRKNYAKKMNEILNPNGKLAGLLFDDKLNTDKPPFGGNKEEYLEYFTPYFQIKTFEACFNSIVPRKDRELFMILIKK